MNSRGLTLAETLIALFVFALITGATLFTFRGTLNRSHQRVLFGTSTKQVDVSVEKLVEALHNSTAHGVSQAQLDSRSSVVAVQAVDKLDSQGAVTWENALHLFWRDAGASTLCYARVDEAAASKAGVTLSTSSPERIPPEDLRRLQEASAGKSLVPYVREFRVSGSWLTSNEPLTLELRTVNPRMEEQTYTVHRSVRLR